MTRVSVPVDMQVEHVTERLVNDFAGRIDADVVRSLVSEVYAAFSAAPVQQFVPVLIDRSVRQRLRTG